MFKHRVITAIVLAVIGYYFITIATETAFLVLEALLLLLAIKEWSYLVKFNTFAKKFLMALALIVGVFVLYSVPTAAFGAIVVGWWLFAAYWVVAYQRKIIMWPTSSFILGLLGVLLIAPLFVSGYMLKRMDVTYEMHSLLFVIIVIALCDVMAYFFGKTIGNHLLASQVSPKKTWEGIVGGIVASSLLSVPVAYWCDVSDTVNPWMILPAIVIAATSILGDLTESVCKRNAGIKDSGNILPGHGGILDRFDSYTAGVPIAYLLLQFIK